MAGAVEELVTLARAPDRSPAERHAAFGQLVVRFQDMAYGCAYALLDDSYLAQAAAQDAFIAAYQHLDQLREPAAFPGWFRRIVIRQCSHVARQEPRPARPLEEMVAIPADTPDPASVAENRELKDAVLALIGALPEGQRAAMVLYYVDGYSQREVADFLEVPVTTVKQWLVRARRRLRERMLVMVQQGLQEQRPSHDERFVQMVRLATELDGAASEGQLAALELMLLDGIDVNAQGPDGRTLLHWAAQNGRAEIVELLLRSGADPARRDRSGRTARELALNAGQRGAADVFRQHGIVE